MDREFARGQPWVFYSLNCSFSANTVENAVSISNLPTLALCSYLIAELIHYRLIIEAFLRAVTWSHRIRPRLLRDEQTEKISSSLTGKGLGVVRVALYKVMEGRGGRGELGEGNR